MPTIFQLDSMNITTGASREIGLDEGCPVGWTRTEIPAVTVGQFVRVDGGAVMVLDAYPTPTPSNIIELYEEALDEHLDSVAAQYRFKDRTRLALRAGYPSAYQPLGMAFGTWMDDCNVQAYATLQDVLAGRQAMPTLEEFINALQAFVAP